MISLIFLSISVTVLGISSIFLGMSWIPKGSLSLVFPSDKLFSKMAAVSLAENAPQRYPLGFPQVLPGSALPRLHGHTGAPRVADRGVEKLGFKIFRIRVHQLVNHEKSNKAVDQIRPRWGQRP